MTNDSTPVGRRKLVKRRAEAADMPRSKVVKIDTAETPLVGRHGDPPEVDVDTPAPKAGASVPGQHGARAIQPARSQWHRLFVPFACVVLLPTVLASLYYALIAADQYQTETQFSVRSAEGAQRSSVLGVLAGGLGIGRADDYAMSVASFVTSHDAVKALDRRLDLRAIFRRPEADFIARLPEGASLEELTDYYESMVEATFDTASGITTVRVRAFRPEDAEAIASALLELSEALVNEFNRRAEEDSLRIAREAVNAAEARLSDIRVRLTRFRLENDEIDPTRRSGGILEIITALEQDYAETSARLSEMLSYMAPDNLQVETVRQRLKAIEEQIRAEQRRLTGTDAGLAEQLSEYELLLLERELASEAYTSALASLESARIEAQRQQNYLVPVVAPHVPEEAKYPERAKNVLLVFLGALLLFAVGRLIVAGVRDHLMT
jgi:capsular polysaccharide transport system permease protein